MLIFPLCVTLVLEDVNSKRAKSGTVKADIAKTLAIFSAAFIGLNYASYVLMANSWNFIYSTHGFTLGKHKETRIPSLNGARLFTDFDS